MLNTGTISGIYKHFCQNGKNHTAGTSAVKCDTNTENSCSTAVAKILFYRDKNPFPDLTCSVVDIAHFTADMPAE